MTGSSTNSHPPVRTDPESGLKLFNTRAEKSSDRVEGTGYGINQTEHWRTMPEFKKDLAYDDDAKGRVRNFNDSRRDTDNYMKMEGEFARYLEDHYSAPPIERESLNDECEILIVGAGFAGLLLWYRLQNAGFKDVRICEKGGDVGGTWYWNRYPGIACDVESYSYLPLLDEMGYYPTMKFASGFEIFEYCQEMAKKFGFYDRCLFHTEVTEALWSEDAKQWTVGTSRGDSMQAKYVMLANGTLSTPRLAQIKGMEKFNGDSFHTARWDYDISLAGKRVGVIGTGATAVQAIPEIAKEAEQLYVFQRTPSTIDVRDQRETTAEEIAEWKQLPGWARARRERFAKLIGRRALQANDDFLSGKVEKPKRRLFGDGKRLEPAELIKRELETSHRIMEQIRDRIDMIIEDPATAKAMKPYYPYGCKRPTFHDEYLPTFNLPHVSLVDTAPIGVQEINENGIMHDGVQYDLDAIVYATGFDFMSHESMGLFKNASGKSIAQKWQEDGVRTFVGVHTHEFPNLFIIAGPQGTGGSFNFTDAIEEHSEYVVSLLSKTRDLGHDVIDVNEDAELDFAEHCAKADLVSAPLRDCIGNFTGYGRAAPGSLGYYGGRKAMKLRDWALETLEPFTF